MMQDMDEKIRNMHTGRLVRILNHQLKREHKPVETPEENELTPHAETCAETHFAGNSPQRYLSEEYRGRV